MESIGSWQMRPENQKPFQARPSTRVHRIREDGYFKEDVHLNVLVCTLTIRTTVVSTVQSMLRKQLLQPNNMGMLSLYTEVVMQLRAKVPHHRAAPTRTAAGGPNLFDEEDTPEDVASHRQLTRPHLQKKYAKSETWTPAPETWTPAPAPSPPPPGYRLVEIAGYHLATTAI